MTSASLDFLKDWGEIILGVLALIAGYIYWKKQGSHKELSYTSDTVNILENKVVGINNKLAITYNHVELDELFVTTLTIINTGQLPIDTSDFDSDIYVQLLDSNGNQITPLDWQIDEVYGINIGFTPNEDRSGIKGRLMNKKDQIKLIYFCSIEPVNCQVKTRISGVSTIKEIKDPKEKDLERRYVKSKHLVFAILGFVLGYVVLILFAEPNQTISSRSNETSIYMVFAAFLYIVVSTAMMYPVYKLYKIKNRSRNET